MKFSNLLKIVVSCSFIFCFGCPDTLLASENCERAFPFAIILGDWSQDGHGLTKRYYVRTNFSRDQIDEALLNAERLVGFNFKETIARRHLESAISRDDLELIRKALSKRQIEIRLEDEEHYDVGEPIAMTEKDFFNIWVALVRLGNEKFSYSLVPADEIEIRIGGYGLFEL